MLTLANARLIDPCKGTESPGTVIIDDGLIVEVIDNPGRPTVGWLRSRGYSEDAEIIDCGGHCLAPGIVDVGVKVCEPGERHKESFRTAGLAAVAGGVTTMVVRPDTVPAIDSPEILEFVHRRAVQDSLARVVPMAALTKGRDGREMAEIGFLMDAGAVAFSDADNVVQDARVLGRCLSYAAGCGALVIGHAQNPDLSDGAAATSGAFASKLGLPAVSPIAERIQLERDMALVEMTGARYHVDQLTTAVALPVLARAREAGLDVTFGTSVHHLTLNELDVEGYRTFFKVKPPLRCETDRMAIVEAVADGQIDIISSMHTPQDEESKRLPFEQAASGAIGLETLLPASLRLVHNGFMTLPQLWRCLSFNPARRLGLDGGRLEAGAPADLVLFDPEKPFVLDRFTLRSKSKNTPFDGHRMQGKVLRTFIGGKAVHSHAA